MPKFEYICEKCDKTFKKRNREQLIKNVKKHAKAKHNIELKKSEIEKKRKKTIRCLIFFYLFNLTKIMRLELTSFSP